MGQRPTLPPLTNGSIVYFAERGDNFDLYRLDLQTRRETQLTDTPSNELYPAVSPDGTLIAYMSDADGDYDIYVMSIDGSNVRHLTTNAVTDRAPAWSPDGTWIAYSSDIRNDGSHVLYRIHPNGSDQTLRFRQRSAQQRSGLERRRQLDLLHGRRDQRRLDVGDQAAWMSSTASAAAPRR